MPEWVSTDDGYASAKGRDEVLGMGVGDLSISGAKGKKLTALEDWSIEEYRDARRNRFVVESLMFTIKDGFEFGELGRRGLQAEFSQHGVGFAAVGDPQFAAEHAISVGSSEAT